MMVTELTYQSSKTYTHAHGFSCAFRQWKANSHCHFLHGYALQIELTWEGDLDERNWVVDFGGLKPIKTFLEQTFDHKTVIADDDPMREAFWEMHHKNIIDLVILPAVGCEKFAEYIFQTIDGSVSLPADIKSNAKLQSVTVREHAGNSATVIRK